MAVDRHVERPVVAVPRVARQGVVVLAVEAAGRETEPDRLVGPAAEFLAVHADQGGQVAAVRQEVDGEQQDVPGGRRDGGGQARPQGRRPRVGGRRTVLQRPGLRRAGHATSPLPDGDDNPLWHGFPTVPPGLTAGLREVQGDLRSAAVARSGDRATTGRARRTLPPRAMPNQFQLFARRGAGTRLRLQVFSRPAMTPPFIPGPSRQRGE